MANWLTMTVDNAALHSYTYDAIYQLTYADYPAGQGADTSYAYDSVFNRTSVSNGSVTSYSANGLNQYTAVGSASLSYDNNGNLTSDGTYTYEYDIENRLLTVREDGTAVVSYSYNASGRRVSKTVYPTGQYIEYCYDGDQVIAEYDGSGTLLRKYIYGPGVDEPICMIAVDGQTETRYYYHYDGLGSVIALSNTNGTIVERYRYSAFGQTQILSPSYQTRTTSLVGNPYMFTGRDYETQIGLYYYRARFYNPDLGRFLQTDPIGYADGLNWYAYCGNNPINFVDPMGLCGNKYNNHLTTGDLVKRALAEIAYDTANVLYYGIHTGLDIVGIYDPTPTCDFWNAAGYAGEGDWTNVVFSAASMLPYAGDLIGKGGKVTKVVLENADSVTSTAKTVIHGHHPWPQYLGGPAKQALNELPSDLHTAYHSGLDNILPRQKGTDFYENLSGSEQAENFEKFRQYTQKFDEKHGTKLWEAVKSTASAE